MDGLTELLTEELKKLVGWGATPQRLALLPVLRSLSGVGEEVSLMTAGYMMRRFLVHKINSLAGTYGFAGREVEAERMRRAYKLLFKIEGTDLNHIERRGRAITLLETYCSIDQWRRFTPEWDFLMILAEHICQTPPQTVAKPA